MATILYRPQCVLMTWTLLPIWLRPKIQPWYIINVSHMTQSGGSFTTDMFSENMVLKTIRNNSVEMTVIVDDIAFNEPNSHSLYLIIISFIHELTFTWGNLGLISNHKMMEYEINRCHRYNNWIMEPCVELRPWWRHQTETFSVLMAICVGNSLVTSGFPVQRPVTRSFAVFFDLRLIKR